MKGNSEEYGFQGKVKWARLVQPDRYQNWSIVLYPTEHSLNVIRELQSEGLKSQLRKDDDGWHITLRRPQQRVYKGIVRGFTPPVIEMKDGTPFRDLSIGNGSDVTAVCEVYKYTDPVSKSKGMAARLKSVRVDNLVPFNKESYDERQKYLVKGLQEQPEQEFWN